MTETQNKPIDIRKTVNLPKTSFSMRANLSQNEPKTLARWKKQNLYQTLVDSRQTHPSFTFHDGPPYANGHIHLGHLLNKVLKDFVVRSQFELGNCCKFTPGWDCHGLPIEHKVMQLLAESGKLNPIKDLPTDVQKMAIRNACCSYAKKQIKIQSKEMQSLLTLADYESPYLTMSKHFEASTLSVFSKLVSEGIVYRKLKPVHWSIANQTALAEAELEYQDKIDTSVYVHFELHDPSVVSTLFNVSEVSTASLLIWTTTPWTLPANLATAIHKDIRYSLVTLNNTHMIIASDCLDSVASTCGVTITERASCLGSALLGLNYSHPFLDRQGTVIDASYVTTDDGTGLVHIAPGHGTDDYLAGLTHNLEVYCPVQADGTFDLSVPNWLQGKLIWDANPLIVSRLKESGHLVHVMKFSHSYPHDWRSKTPVIFRATEQWFISVDTPIVSADRSLRELALNTIDTSIEFFPEWGRNRLRGMLESRPDWCISRQRSWGLPIPAFRSGDIVLLTPASIDAVTKIIRNEGSDAWFKQSAQSLLSDYDPKQDPDFPKGFTMATAEKMYDIFDVWFESGSSWNAVLQDQHGSFPADLYLEGSDQHRGWFHLSLLPSLGIHQQAPYKRLLTHGFIVDKDGKKMSKSVGNTLNVQELLGQYGAEVTRWWVSSLSYETDIKVDLSYFDSASDGYRKIRNTIRFLLSNLYDYTVHPITEIQDLIPDLIPENSIEAYVLARLDQYKTDCHNAYKTFQFKTAHQLLYDCCTELLSSFYCSISKDILYCDRLDSDKRRRIQFTFQIILETVLRLLHPILPHTSEEAYQSLYQSPDLVLAMAPPFTISIPFSCDEWAPLLDFRHTVLKQLEDHKSKGIENSLDAGLVISTEYQRYETAQCSLADLFGVSRIAFHDSDAIHIQDLRSEPRCERSWKRDITVKQRLNGHLLSDRDADAIEQNKG